jgi:hypothetical protein
LRCHVRVHIIPADAKHTAGINSGETTMPKPIKEKTYMLVLEYAARVLIDKEEAERTGRAFDLDKYLQNALHHLDAVFAHGPTRGVMDLKSRRLDLEAIQAASNLVVDYVMLTGEIRRLKGQPAQYIEQPDGSFINRDGPRQIHVE